jgi:hypothetical protein
MKWFGEKKSEEKRAEIRTSGKFPSFGGKRRRVKKREGKRRERRRRRRRRVDIHPCLGHVWGEREKEARKGGCVGGRRACVRKPVRVQKPVCSIIRAEIAEIVGNRWKSQEISRNP